jgi:hypothetical protein
VLRSRVAGEGKLSAGGVWECNRVETQNPSVAANTTATARVRRNRPNCRIRGTSIAGKLRIE